MKKKVIRMVVTAVLTIAVIGGCAAVVVLNTPEYALLSLVLDTEEYGLDGLRPHLSQKAQTSLDRVDAISDYVPLHSLLSLLDREDRAADVREELAEIDWSLDEVRRKSGTATLYLRFEYRDRVRGTLPLTMVREGGKWKLDSIRMPQIEELNW